MTSGWPLSGMHADQASPRASRRSNAGAAVGDAGDVDARLVDVVVALHAVDEPQDVVDLIGVPPLRLRPSARVQHDLARARNAIGQRTRRRIARARRLAPDAAMQAHAQRPGTRGIVVGRHLDDVVEGEAVTRDGSSTRPVFCFA